MKIAFTGKGGVGKTTLASLFIGVLAKDGQEVLAVDCDPDSNLGRVLGFKEHEKIIPIARMDKLINERMGVEAGNKSFFKLNPKIDDIPDKFSQTKGNIKLIVMGAVKEGGSGCMCPENTFIKNLIEHLILQRDEHVVMDMEAGVEHFGRGTAQSCDFVLVVVEPSLNSIESAKKISGFARDIGIKKIYCIGNKIRSQKDKSFINKRLNNIKLIETIDFDQHFLDWDKKKDFLIPSERISKRLEKVKQFLERELS
ncbi:MAG: AAA family ATPase [Omnitrophica bacterium]|nr:AAA family ATPase [Candidatus Omnitrophota bacterium]